MKTLNAIMSIISATGVIGAMYAFLTCREDAVKWFFIMFICIQFTIAFYAFYMVEYWKQRWEEAVGLRKKGER